MKPHPQCSDFVADGCDRAWNAMGAAVRQEVEAEFANAWNASGCLRRWFLRRKINAEIARRLAERAPPDALY